MATARARKRPGGTAPIAASVQGQAEKMLRTGNRFKSFDQIRQRHFWSSYYFVGGTTGYVPAGRYTVFTTPVGNNGQGFPAGTVVTDRESNWKSQNRVPDNQNFEIHELGCSLMSADFATSATFPLNEIPPASIVSNFFRSTVLSITYLTNQVPLGLLSDFAQPSGFQFGCNLRPVAADADPVVPANTVAINGFAAPALRRKFKIPILLQHGESFNFLFDVQRPMYVGYAGGSSSAAFLIRLDFWATESFVEQS